MRTEKILSPPGFLPYLSTEVRWKSTVGRWKGYLRRSYREVYTRLKDLGFAEIQCGYWSYHALWTSEYYDKEWNRTVVMGSGVDPQLDAGTEVGVLLGVNCHHEVVFRFGGGVVEKWELAPKGILPGVDCSRTARIKMSGGGVVWGCEVYWDAKSKVDRICEGAAEKDFKIVDADLDLYRRERNDRERAHQQLKACSGEFWTL